MKFKRFLCALVVALFTLQTVGFARMDEGMWPFNNIPRDEIKKKYGFDVTDEWLKKVQFGLGQFQQRWFRIVCVAERSRADELSHRRRHR